MKENTRIPIIEDWYLGTDGMSFLLLRRRVVGTTQKHTKADNIGKEQFDTMGYYPTLGSIAAGLHRYLSIEVLMRGGISTLEEYVAKLNDRISGIKRLDETMVNRLREQMGVANERGD